MLPANTIRIISGEVLFVPRTGNRLPDLHDINSIRKCSRCSAGLPASHLQSLVCVGVRWSENRCQNSGERNCSGCFTPAICHKPAVGIPDPEVLREEGGS